MVTVMLVLKKIWEGIQVAGAWCWKNKYVPVAVISAIIGAILYHEATDEPDGPAQNVPPKRTNHVKKAKKAVKDIHDKVEAEHKPEMDKLDQDEEKIDQAEKIHDEETRLNSLAELGQAFRDRRKNREGDGT